LPTRSPTTGRLGQPEAADDIVVVISTQGIRASRDVGQFAATQHSMRAITDSLRQEVNADGIRVCSSI
jgi:NADP-dependent 3-hydroxy acid dehydrogenase YdfG